MKIRIKSSDAKVPPTFIDLFSGCGGLSLGMTAAGFRGLFAVEKAPDAYLTFHANLLDSEDSPFVWPPWLKKKNIGIEDFLAKYVHRLSALRNKVGVITGGPPCQGFSFAGRRNGKDPRNKLFRKYVDFVDAVRPQMIVLENVPGMKVVHGAGKRKKKTPGPKPKSYYDKLIELLATIGYRAEGRLLDATDFGVPQKRSRLVVVGIREESLEQLPGGFDYIFDCIRTCAAEQVRQMGLTIPVSAKSALSDLETAGGRLIPCEDPMSPKGFQMLRYSKPLTAYQRLMNDGLERGEMDSMRLAKHTEAIKIRFTAILEECRRGVNLSEADRERFGMLKHRTLPMAPGNSAPTLTSLPDDVLHYSEARILTVREYARLQSFPDRYQFKGKYTTGGERRRKDCPRYTQIGNAVPPLLAQGIGHALVLLLEELAALTPHYAAPNGEYTRELVSTGI